MRDLLLLLRVLALKGYADGTVIKIEEYADVYYRCFTG
jgi:hypothetical protein